MDPSGSLARRLRELRETALGSAITQKQLSTAIGASTATISAWESGKAAPSVKWLRSYATYFATRASLDRTALVPDDELAADERVVRDGLFDELTALAPTTAAVEPEPTVETGDFWSFPDGRPVRIICGRLADERPVYAEPGHRNYVKLSGYADLDALVELFAHVRRINPESDVRFALPEDIEDDDLTATHLVLLGNLAGTQSVLRNWLAGALPVRQQRDPELGDDGEVFVVEGEERAFGPVRAPDGGTAEFAEDVGFLARMPSPLDHHRTLTICSGVFTRGVYGAVRSTTDLRLAPNNTAFLRQHFEGARTFGLLIRVRIGRTVSPTPRLDDPSVRLFEFDDRTS